MDDDFPRTSILETISYILIIMGLYASAGSPVQTLYMGSSGKGVYFIQVEQNRMKPISSFMFR